MNFEAELSATSSSTKSSINNNNNLEELEGENQSRKRRKVENSRCQHGLYINDTCTNCGDCVKDESAVAFGYIHKGLKIGQEEITKLRESNLKNLLENRKLCLILDLDHTLVNSTQKLSPKEESLKDNIVRLELICGTFFTKLRPGVERFLEEASQMYELYVCTLGHPWYALEIVKLLDPQEKYFKCRVISHFDCTYKNELKKGLDVVLAPENAVVVLDDTSRAWSKHPQNLVHMNQYHYFASSAREYGLTSPSLSELGEDEKEEDGPLSNMLRVLKDIHTSFFDAKIGGDVKLVMHAMRQEVLKGCVFYFGDLGKGSEYKSIQSKAVKLGALRTKNFDPRVTHVVTTNANSEEAYSEKFLVHPKWIEVAYYSWKREPEENYLLKQNMN